MPQILITFCFVLLLAIRCLGQTAPATQPAEEPPATNEAKTVLILPFVTPSEARYKDSGRAIQQDLASSLAGNLRGRVIAPTKIAPAADSQAALEAAQKASAGAVIFGQMQVNQGQVRISGQVLNAQSGKSVGSLKQSGPLDTLFQLEDALTPQAIAALPAPLLNLHGLLSTRPIASPRIIYLPGDAKMSQQQPRGPIDGGYAGPIAPYTLPPPPGGTPPYSSYAGSYPYRFRAPYAYLFSYDYDPDPFLPLYGGFYPHRFGWQTPVHAPAAHDEPHDAARPHDK